MEKPSMNSPLFFKQVKGMSYLDHSGLWKQVGNPLFRGRKKYLILITKMRKGQEITGGRKTVIITDPDIMEMINDLMKLPEYNSSFNKVANHSLMFGVPKLYDKVFMKNEYGDIEEIKKRSVKEMVKTPEEKEIEDYLIEVVDLLKELLINISIVKSVVCSLFNSKLAVYKNIPVPKEMLEDGAYRKTPSYLENYERRAYKDIRGGR